MGDETVSTLAMSDLKKDDRVAVICMHENIVAEIRVTRVAATSLNVNAEIIGRPQDGIQYFSVNGLLGTPWEPRVMLPTALVRQLFTDIGRADARNGCACKLERTVRKSVDDAQGTTRLGWLR